MLAILCAHGDAGIGDEIKKIDSRLENVHKEELHDLSADVRMGVLIT